MSVCLCVRGGGRGAGGGVIGVCASRIYVVIDFAFFTQQKNGLMAY